MKINATAHLYYNEGESISSGWEALRLYVKFKEEGKIFKTRLNKDLVSTFNVSNAILFEPKDRIDSYDAYYKLVNETIEDIEFVKEVAIKMIKEHFEDERKLNKETNDKKNLTNKVKSMPKIEIAVEIK